MWNTDYSLLFPSGRVGAELSGCHSGASVRRLTTSSLLFYHAILLICCAVFLDVNTALLNSIDGALDPWLTTLTSSLLSLLPLPPNLFPVPASSLPPARVKLIDVTTNTPASTSNTGPSNYTVIEADFSRSYPANNLSGVSGTSVAENSSSRNYHTVEVLKNERITAQTWWQDVRHFEFRCEDELRCVFRPVSFLRSLHLPRPYFV